MENVRIGSVVIAEIAQKWRPAIVLEVDSATDEVVVVAISSNSSISIQEDLIKVPRMLGMTTTCYVQCDVTRTVHKNSLRRWKDGKKKIFGEFELEVRRQVKAARERAATEKTSTQS